MCNQDYELVTKLVECAPHIVLVDDVEADDGEDEDAKTDADHQDGPGQL